MQVRIAVAIFATAALSVGGAAVANDRPAQARAPLSDWSGFYAGGSVGARFANVDWDTTAVADGFGVGGGTTPDPTTRRANFDNLALRGALYAGYNRQFAPRWFAGVEADIGWANNSKTLAGLPGAEGPVINAGTRPGDATTVRGRWDASIRGRLGYLVNPSLLAYATGGASWLRIEAQATCVFIGGTDGWCVADRNETHSWTKLGWTIGAGIERWVGSAWLARAEYRYADYGTVSPTYFAGTIDQFSADIKVRTHTALVGLSYKFGR